MNCCSIDSEGEVTGMDFIDEESADDFSGTVKQPATLAVYLHDYTSSKWARMLRSPGAGNPGARMGASFTGCSGFAILCSPGWDVIQPEAEVWFPEHDKKTDCTGRPLPPLEGVAGAGAWSSI